MRTGCAGEIAGMRFVDGVFHRVAPVALALLDHRNDDRRPGSRNSAGTSSSMGAAAIADVDPDDSRPAPRPDKSSYEHWPCRRSANPGHRSARQRVRRPLAGRSSRDRCRRSCRGTPGGRPNSGTPRCGQRSLSARTLSPSRTRTICSPTTWIAFGACFNNRDSIRGTNSCGIPVRRLVTRPTSIRRGAACGLAFFHDVDLAECQFCFARLTKT